MARASKALERPPKHDPDSIVLPHNLEAEKSVLGAALLHDVQADYIVDKLIPEMFFRRAHATVFEGVRELRHQGRGVDLTLLAQQLGAKRLADVGGPAYLASLVDGVPRSTNLAHYCDVIRDLAARRRLYEFGRVTLDYVAAGQYNAATLLEDVDRRLAELIGGHGDAEILTPGAGLAMLDRLQWRIDHPGQLTGLATGFASIDELTVGWQAGDLIVLGARPSVGKTTFLLNTAIAGARSIAAAGKRDAVLLFSFEMGRDELEDRLLSSLSGVRLSALQRGIVMGPEWPKITHASGELAELPLRMVVRAGLTRWQIRSICRRVKAEQGLALVGIDYAQLIPGSLERKGANRNEELTDISRGIKLLAEELEIPILLLSQLSRPSKTQASRPPQLTDLRESGAFEQDADNVGFLHRRNHREGGLTHFILEKQRNGPTGSIKLTLDRDVVTFTDGYIGEEEAPKAEAPQAEKAGRRRQAPAREERQWIQN